MPIPEELKKQLLTELEKCLEEVEDCPVSPGSLLPILNRSAHRISRLTTEGLTKAAADKAAFPPSGMSPLRQGENDLSGAENADIDHGTRARDV
jgi:hypothetical protein